MLHAKFSSLESKLIQCISICRLLDCLQTSDAHKPLAICKSFVSFSLAKTYINEELHYLPNPEKKHITFAIEKMLL